MASNQYDVIIIGAGQVSGAKAHCSVHGNPSGWHAESASADFHELGQDFSPLDKASAMTMRLKRNYL